jgi:hypothetical protein
VNCDDEITLEQALALLPKRHNYTIEQLHRWCRRGRLEHIKRGAETYTTREALQATLYRLHEAIADEGH